MTRNTRRKTKITVKNQYTFCRKLVLQFNVKSFYHELNK